MAETEKVELQPVWTPQPGFQHAYLSCPFREMLIGGSRGGGKTDGIVGRILKRASQYGAHYSAVVLRQEMPQADDLIDRAEEVWSSFGKFRRYDKTCAFINGASVRFRPLESIRDANKYHGQNVTEFIVEEAGNYPDPSPIMRLFGALRSAHGVPTSMSMSANPGGSGHAWLKQRYRLDVYKQGMQPLKTIIPARPGVHDEIEHTRIFLPAKITDNKILMQNDPSYIANLYQVGDEKLVRAWIDGDWDAVEGAFFEEWRDARHVLADFKTPSHWVHFRSIDWGFARPFSVGWWTIAGDEIQHDGRTIPRGALIRYREWYGCKAGQHNVGIRLNADEAAAGIKERTHEKIDYTVLDPAGWGSQSGPSIAETLLRNGVPCRKADNKRVATHGHLGGWDQLRQRLRGTIEAEPMIYCTRSCKDSIRLMPQMQHDPLKPEDLDTDMEDHIADEWRYACMSRPWTRSKPLPPEQFREPTFNEWIELAERKRAEDVY